MERPYLATGEYYHVMNRGNQKQNIFKNDKDRLRFLFLILCFQSPYNFQQLTRRISHIQNPISDLDSRCFNISDDEIKEIIDNRYIGLLAFALMPNHFHLLLHNKKERSISEYMQRVLISYTKYFNTKYDQSGHVFQGSYKARIQRDENHLCYTSAYIHRNPYELKEWKQKEHRYPWSSYTDYVKENRWGKLLENEVIKERFETAKDYKDYVRWSDIKGRDDDDMQ